MKEIKIYDIILRGLIEDKTIGSYYLDGDYCVLKDIRISGVSNSTEFKFSLPFLSLENSFNSGFNIINNSVGDDRGGIKITEGEIFAKVCLPNKDSNNSFWTSSGIKGIKINSLRYRIK